MKKYFNFEFKPANIIAAICFAIAGFYLVVNTTNPIYLGLIGAIFIASIHGGLNGVLVGGLLSSGAIVAGILYRSANVILKIGKKWSPEKIAQRQAEFDAHMNNLTSNIVLYALLALLLAFIGRYVHIKLGQFKTEQSHSNTRKLTYFAMFVALGVAINSLRIGPFSFGGFSIIYSGMVLGPVSGFIVGAVTDLLAFLVRPSANAFNPLFVLTSALTGFIPAFVMHVLPGETNKKMTNIFYVILAFAVGQVITSVILVPVFRQMLYGHPLVATMLTSLSRQVWHVPLYAVLFLNTQRVVNKEVNFSAVQSN